MQLAGEAVRRRADLGQGGADRFQVCGDGLTAPGRGRELVRRRVGLRQLLSLEVTAQTGLPGGGLRLRQLLPPDGAGPELLIRRRDVKSVGSEATDLQQNPLLVGGETII